MHVWTVAQTILAVVGLCIGVAVLLLVMLVLIGALSTDTSSRPSGDKRVPRLRR